MRQMAKWKDRFVPSKIDKNPPGLIEKITGEAFSLDDDWEKIEKLKEIYGVAASVASVILHLYDSKKYPILDVHALRTIGIDNQKVNYDEPFWRKYVNLCRVKAERYDVSMRALDRALYKYSELDAVFVMAVIADETLFLELKRRGYDLPESWFRGWPEFLMAVQFSPSKNLIPEAYMLKAENLVCDECLSTFHENYQSLTADLAKILREQHQKLSSLP